MAFADVDTDVSWVGSLPPQTMAKYIAFPVSDEITRLVASTPEHRGVVTLEIFRPAVLKTWMYFIALYRLNHCYEQTQLQNC
jgi:hypothetical protein